MAIKQINQREEYAIVFFLNFCHASFDKLPDEVYCLGFGIKNLR